MLVTVTSAPRTLIDTLPIPRTRTRDVALVVAFAFLTAALAQVRIPLAITPVPITGQTFAVLTAGVVLGARRGAASQLVYWLAGIVAPIAWYSGDTSGSSISAGWKLATGTTAGYLFGFVIAAGVIGYLAERHHDRAVATSVAAMAVGTVIIYTCGATWLALRLGMPLIGGEKSAYSLGIAPFVIGDAFKLAVAGLAAPLAWRALGGNTD